MSSMTAIPQNYKNNVDWILGAYEDAGVTFPNGFQKDAIQNAVGARKTSKWKNWACDISLVENEHGRFVIVEDFGTVGLTGKNTPAEEINIMMAEGKSLEPSERLSRFTSMFNSGGNTTGGGLFGAGKSVYSVASETYTYYFDSLREDGLYVANINQCGQVMSVALENEDAKAYIKENTGLSHKTTVGTRVIIKSPKAELADAITDGSLIPYIQESWWLIIQRLDEGASISVNKVPVEVPADIKAATHTFELQNPESYASSYKVKHFGLYVFEDGNNRWKGISYYRKGMKIGEVDLKDIPEKVNGKFWGYIEVDEEWEDGLSEIEDKVHFGVSKGKKGRMSYQNLKNYCNEKTKANLVEWGYIKDRENEDKKLKDELKKIAEEVQDLFDELGFEDLGKGPQKADFDVRWQDIKYPVDGTEKVTSGDEIKFTMRIKSSYATDKRFEYKLYVLNPNTGKIMSPIKNARITVKSNTVYKESFVHNVSKANSEQYSENRIILSVKVVGSGKEKKKELIYFFDIERPDNSREVVNLTLHECIFPIEGSRRVNFDEAVRNICYKIENKRNQTLHYKLNISIHNANDITYPKIVDVISFKGEIAPCDEKITPFIDKIVFARSDYESHLTEGVLQLRARLIANDDDDQFEKGDKITSYHFNIFLNYDEKNGKNDAFDVQSIDAPDNFRRSWFTPGTNRVIFLNVGHFAYLNVQDYPDIQHEYLREQMLKQYVLLYLAEGKYDMFGEEGKDFADLEPQEAADQVLSKIENVYYRSLG
ncbi:hypothetical protein [Oribacterium sinus]|jgi:hypothetical protein|uniref:hypothetical protein n=1 Tax=Oribacterium sinus TaxID=237576 RepID=UPI0028D3BE3E|nr:hypothetical protein [Oribacterium sinus]